jgi:tetratricopeptide (TPR) repeat protein
MEAARRADEWELIEQAIPSTQAIFKLEAAALRGEYTDQEVLILESVDGDRSVDEVVAVTHVPRFDVCKFLTRLHQEGLAKRAPVDHLLLRGDAYRDAGDIEGALKFYRQAATSKLRKRSEQVDVRRRLAEALEATGDKKEAGEQYKILADLQAEDHNVQGAINYWQKVIDLNPLDLENKERLISVYLENRTHLDPDRSDVIRGIEYSLFKNGKALAMAFSYAGQVDKAKEVLQRLIDITPSNVELRKALVNIHLEHDEKPEAVDELERIASYLVTARQFEEVKAVYRNILKVAPDRDDIKRKLALLEREEAAEITTEKPKKRGRAWVAVLLIVVAAAGAFAFWAFVHVPGKAAPLLAKAEGFAAQVADASAETDPATYQSARDEAVKLFKQVAALYEFTPTSSAAALRAGEVERLFSQKQDEFNKNTDAFLETAEKHRDLLGDRVVRENWEDGALAGDLDAAIQKYRGIAKAAGVITTLEGWKKEIADYSDRIDAEFAKALKAEQSGDLKSAWKILRALRSDEQLALKRKLPKKWAAIRFPYEVRSTPPGAAVSINDVAQGGDTPTKPLHESLGRRVLIELTRRGYEPIERGYVVGDPEVGPTVHFDLKLAGWYPKPHVVPTPFNLSTPLVPVPNSGGAVVAATDNGWVRTLTPLPAGMQQTGADLRVQKKSDPTKNSPTGSPAVLDDLVVCSRKDGVVLFYKRGTPDPVLEYRLFDEAQDDARYQGEEPVGAPVIAPEPGVVLITTNRGRIHAVKIGDATRVWANAPFGEETPTLTEPTVTDGYVIAASDHGWLVGLSLTGTEQATGKYAFRFQVAAAARIAHRPSAVSGGLITVVTSAGRGSTLFAFSLMANRADPATLTKAWAQSFELRGTPVGPPLMLAGEVKAVIVGASDGRGGAGRLMGLTLVGGDLLWTEFPDGVKTQPQLQMPAVWKNRLYALAGGRLTVHDVATGRLAHTLDLDDKALPRFGPTVTSEGHVIAVLRAGPENRLYTFKE